MEIKLIYYGVIYSKKNNKQIITNHRTGRPMLTSSRMAKAMEYDMAYQFSSMCPKQARDLKAPLEILITIWEKDHQRRDLDNQATSILDALVKAEVIPDDSVKVVERLEMKLGGYDKVNPRAEIIIREGGQNV